MIISGQVLVSPCRASEAPASSTRLSRSDLMVASCPTPTLQVMFHSAPAVEWVSRSGHFKFSCGNSASSTTVLMTAHLQLTATIMWGTP